MVERQARDLEVPVQVRIFLLKSKVLISQDSNYFVSTCQFDLKVECIIKFKELIVKRDQVNFKLQQILYRNNNKNSILDTKKLEKILYLLKGILLLLNT